MDKDEIIDMINVGIKGVLEKHIDEKNDGIFRAMRANEENCKIIPNYYMCYLIQIKIWIKMK